MKKKIALIPIDNRPVCYNLPKDIASVDKSIELILPPREFLGDLENSADTDALLSWLEQQEDVDVVVIALDTLIYGGLIPSRRCEYTIEEFEPMLEILKEVLKDKEVYAFSSIMRIPNNNCNEEENEYWNDYGKKIFQYSFFYHKFGGKLYPTKSYTREIPDEIFNDYLSKRKRNFEINKRFLEWEKEGIFKTLIFSKDDCAKYGLNVLEAQVLEQLGATIKTGADEIPLSLLASAIEKNIKVCPLFIEDNQKSEISNYEDISIEESVKGQINMCGFEIVSSQDEADLVLIVNNFIESQGEHVMGWNSELFSGDFYPPQKPYAIADVRYANGADNNFVEQVLGSIDVDNFYGYAGWNTSANTLGSLLACVKFKWNAEEYDNEAFKRLQLIRFLDDWAYQANVRYKIEYPDDIKSQMQDYETYLKRVLKLDNEVCISYSYPWNRKFEIEIAIEENSSNKEKFDEELSEEINDEES